MSEFSYAVGGASSVTIDGQTYLLGKIGVNELGTLINLSTQRIAKRLLTHAAEAAATAPKPIQEMLISKAWDEYRKLDLEIGPDHINAYILNGNMDVYVDVMFVALDANHKGKFTREKVAEWFSKLDDIQKKIAFEAVVQVSGVGDPNSTAPQDGAPESQLTGAGQ